MPKITLTEENYLKALFHVVDSEGKVTINELSKFLNVKMPSVNNMMKKFAEKGWVVYETYKPLLVTEKGRREAALVVRKHRLTEMFLVKNMNFGWENVHEIAEQLEHVHSQVFFDKMDEILNYPKFDPHGEPIPDKDGNIIAQDLQKLSSCETGEMVIFTSVTLSDDAFLSYLNERSLLLDTQIKVIKIEDFDKSMTIEIEGKKEILSKKATEKILVRK
ncbi:MULTISPECIES: metal-dependent transcriptional regulator [Chryseobacterium]|uniref:Transcriptional regulator MntR n=1 Tax=Chryseobacterium camelliae TaxID=1265445 RepID=A0ABU0TGY4_9FLAO|nr:MULTISPECIES: metal-dependent transcriptional regulator [Chryseobacterium]MDT3405981.1 DtxR family Mn-dependent transcriptional regulator [Pseudacidovorax intermedius]MDQ1096216.1 DtxR family Mn-dependent transcriptional regulator [Chryseobacterium camelliae]MDQ1100153.1 DtxR family Mn-dependent transcriptional regulator [Chryseobacterium sp. SORGH_AS_1048]MDR6087496.1 DtxR family Mn-dependent transcriptional regulator [Chryseobacterium sp. SORGH_AS_0909]MDR6131870.1 DtxR family Mn-dependen